MNQFWWGRRENKVGVDWRGPWIRSVRADTNAPSSSLVSIRGCFRLSKHSKHRLKRLPCWTPPPLPEGAAGRGRLFLVTSRPAATPLRPPTLLVLYPAPLKSKTNKKIIDEYKIFSIIFRLSILRFSWLYLCRWTVLCQPRSCSIHMTK